MSNYIGWGIHPKTKKVEQAYFMDNHFGQYKYGVKFQADDKVYRDEEVEVPKDWQVTESEEYQRLKAEEDDMLRRIGIMKDLKGNPETIAKEERDLEKLRDKIHKIVEESHRADYWEGVNKYNAKAVLEGVTDKIMKAIEKEKSVS